MFGLGKKKIDSDDIGMIFIKESFDSVNGLYRYIASTIDGFAQHDQSVNITSFLDNNAISEKDRVTFCYIYTLCVSTVFLERSKNPDAIAMHMGTTFQLGLAMQNYGININVKTINTDLEYLLRDNEAFEERGELYPENDFSNTNGLYFQLSEYFLEKALSINSKAYEACLKNKEHYQVALFNCFNRFHDSSNTIMRKYTVDTSWF